MSMFDWAPSAESRPIVSPYIWLYWTISVPLTAIVLLTWRIWWKFEDKKHQADLYKAKRENENSLSAHGVIADGQCKDREGYIKEKGHASSISTWDRSALVLLRRLTRRGETNDEESNSRPRVHE
jgi:hypothetical protein